MGGILSMLGFFGTYACFMTARRAEPGSQARGLWWVATAVVFASNLVVTGVFH